MVKTPLLIESHVAEKVKNLMLTEITSGMTKVLEQAGINLFHLNLDALPGAEERGQAK